MNGACTCGPFWSVVPPEPCPIHDPERAYWRAKYLRDFGGGGWDRVIPMTTTTDWTPEVPSPTRTR